MWTHRARQTAAARLLIPTNLHATVCLIPIVLGHHYPETQQTLSSVSQGFLNFDVFATPPQVDGILHPASARGVEWQMVFSPEPEVIGDSVMLNHKLETLRPVATPRHLQGLQIWFLQKYLRLERWREPTRTWGTLKEVPHRESRRLNSHRADHPEPYS